MTTFIHRLLIRLGIIGTPEEDAYYSWADQRLDEIDATLNDQRARQARNAKEREHIDRAQKDYDASQKGDR